MKPYAKILSLLEALPPEERLLASLARRTQVGEQECGCLFGTLLPKGGFPLDDDPSCWSFRNEARLPDAQVSRWGHAILNLDTLQLYPVVRKLELINDYFAPENNDYATCRDRYNHVCARLRELAAIEEQ